MSIDYIFRGYNQGTIDEIKRFIADAGCVVVPREPTKEMLDAGNKAYWDSDHDMGDEMADAWRAAIAAVAV